MNNKKLETFRLQLDRELKENILPFWINNALDFENGGFYGYISNEGTASKEYDKGSVLNSRILWTFSSAFLIYGDKKYLEVADRAYNYILEHFLDKDYSGIYWMVDCKGKATVSKKQTYATAFTIYGFSEYFRAIGNRQSLDKAIELFETLEKHAYDRENKGYFEAFARDWSPLADMSLSEKDMNVQKTMNSHLHILEAYTSLLRVWNDQNLRKKLGELIETVMEHIIDKNTFCFKLYFDEYWNSKSDIISFGHDIEGSWLLHEAAEVLGDEELLKRVGEISVKMAQGVYERGIDPVYGGVFNENISDRNKDWWPQAEAVVGFFNTYQMTGNECYLEAAYKAWSFIDNYIIDKENGEWFHSVSEDRIIHKNMEKAGPWKCPYHNSRMCIEIINRINRYSRL